MKSLMLSCLFMALSLPGPGYAGDGIPKAYLQVGQSFGIPPVILYSMALTESGKPYRGERLPWPWTVNHAGRGIYFPSRQAAYAYLSRLVARGDRSFDVGLMQVNWRWNADVFGGSLWDALDPYVNLRGGAAILRRHYLRTGSFESAVGAYHSPGDPRRASAYRERVRGALATVLRRGGRF